MSIQKLFRSDESTVSTSANQSERPMRIFWFHLTDLFLAITEPSQFGFLAWVIKSEIPVSASLCAVIPVAAPVNAPFAADITRAAAPDGMVIKSLFAQWCSSPRGLIAVLRKGAIVSGLTANSLFRLPRTAAGRDHPPGQGRWKPAPWSPPSPPPWKPRPASPPNPPPWPQPPAAAPP
jgi:hypothetical protein